MESARDIGGKATSWLWWDQQKEPVGHRERRKVGQEGSLNKLQRRLYIIRSYQNLKQFIGSTGIPLPAI